MAEIIAVPEVAAGATEVVVSEWLVEPGSSFSAGHALVVIETDKAIVEIESEVSATLLRRLVEPGGAVEVGAPLVLVGTPEELDADLDAVLAGLGVAAAVPGGEPTRRDVPEPVAEPPAPAAAELSAPAAAAPPASAAPQPNVVPSSHRRFASPIARRLLREAGADLADVVGTGPDGRVVRRDVETFLGSKRGPRAESEAPAPNVHGFTDAPQESGPWTDIPHSRRRRAVATRLTASKSEVPHFYVRRSARIDALLELRRRLNAVPGARISVNDLVLRAVAVAHREVPDVNAIWTEDAVRRFDHVDIGVAIASHRGLVTPVLRSVETKSIGTISTTVKSFAADAAEGRLKQSDLEGGSVAVTNLGMYDVEEFAAIINPPHATILAVGAGRREPVVGTAGGPDEIGVATVIRLVGSVDHRVVDGALAATWMGAIVDALEDPLRLLI